MRGSILEFCVPEFITSVMRVQPSEPAKLVLLSQQCPTLHRITYRFHW